MIRCVFLIFLDLKKNTIIQNDQYKTTINSLPMTTCSRLAFKQYNKSYSEIKTLIQSRKHTMIIRIVANKA